MRINNNLMAMNTHRAMGSVAGAQSKSMEKLSSGYRINRAGDDAAGLAISEKMRGQIRGLNQASRNSQDAISMVQTAEGALNETQNILQRMRELAVQSANDTNVDDDRSAIQNEIDQLSTEITRISDTTEFNTQQLLNGGLKDIKFQIGANESQNMELSIGDMSAENLKVVKDSIEIGENGAGVTGVEADLAFDIENSVLTATSGGAVAATLDADKTGVTTDGYVPDVTMQWSTGVTNAGSVTFDGANEIALADDDIKWSSVLTSGQTSTIVISDVNTSGVRIQVDVMTVSGGINKQTTIDDTIYANSGGDFVYDAHGISFTINADDFADLVANDVSVNLTTINSGNGLSFVSGIDTASNFKANVLVASGSTYTAFTTDIVFDESDAQFDANINQIQISGGGLSNSGGTIEVTLTGTDGNISTDVFQLSGGANFSGNTFTYDNHGVSFTIAVGDSASFAVDQALVYSAESYTVGAGASLEFDITDDAGNDISLTVAMDAGEYSLADIADAINAAGSGSAGTFGTDIATVASGTIKLASQTTGADSVIDITGEVGFSGIFDTATDGAGADTSLSLTLTVDGTKTFTETGVAPSATSVTFTDSGDNTATFDLKGYADITGVDISDTFSASNLTREVTGIDISSQEAASQAITTINDALTTVSTERSKLGAVQNRLEHTIANLDTSAENLQASESRIRDVDMAKEMMEFTKNNILQQAAQSMLAQANQAPQGVLQLLR